MQRVPRVFLLFLLIVSSLVATTNISVQSELGKDTYAAGDTVEVALIISIPESYHLYSNPIGPGIGKPLSITPKESSEITWISAVQQEPIKYVTEGFEDQWTWVWDDESIIVLTGIVEESTKENVTTSIELDGLTCKTACIPVNATAEIIIDISGKSDHISFEQNDKVRTVIEKALPISMAGLVITDASGAEQSAQLATDIDDVPDSIRFNWDYSPQESGVELNLGLALFFAFLAGVILNFMPCVLPVLGIKILSFSNGRTESKAKSIGHSLSFALGMIFVFMILASMAAFADKSWGEQFQEPLFIVGIVGMMFVFALGMFDLFIIFVPNKVAEMDMKQDNSTFMGNFSKGVFATILATPCSGPFLGATLAWTLTQSNVVIYLVFLFLGLGMASPYVLLAASSRLSKIIPKPGAWMEDFKHILGFILIGFAVYLMIGLPRDMVLPTVALLVFLAASIMVYKRIVPFGSSIGKKLFGWCMILLVVGMGYYISFRVLYPQLSEENIASVENESKVTWIPFSAEALMQAEADGQSVILDFTANWCMNCQLNKVNVYHSDEIEALILDKNIIAMKADLTSENPTAEALREHLGSRSVPFLAIFDGDDPLSPVIMRDVVSKKQVKSALIDVR